MDRRGFLKLIGATAGGLALERAIPFGRVWSFPKRILRPGVFAVPPASSIRFIKAWDVSQSRAIGRIDVVMGLEILDPSPYTHSRIFRNATRREQLIAIPPGFPHAGGVNVLQETVDECSAGVRPELGQYLAVDTWIEEDS